MGDGQEETRMQESKLFITDHFDKNYSSNEDSEEDSSTDESIEESGTHVKVLALPQPIALALISYRYW